MARNTSHSGESTPAHVESTEVNLGEDTLIVNAATIPIMAGASGMTAIISPGPSAAVVHEETRESGTSRAAASANEVEREKAPRMFAGHVPIRKRCFNKKM